MERRESPRASGEQLESRSGELKERTRPGASEQRWRERQSVAAERDRAADGYGEGG